MPKKCPRKSDETCILYGFHEDYIKALGRDEDEIVEAKKKGKTETKKKISKKK